MTINIQYQNMPESDSLSTIVTQKLDKLAYKYPSLIRCDVVFKMGNSSDGLDNICEMEISAPGPRVFAKSIESNFEKAAAITIDELERMLRKRKDKLNKRKRAV
ncbi:MAG: HPF/RaiA family ribosome-associated protein [Flavobacteriaceae bacterium]